MRVKDNLSALAFRPSKTKGQNFTINPEVLRAVIEFSPVQPEVLVVEIGPGLGALTEELLKFAPVTAIEIETILAEQLRKKFANLTVITSDVRELDFSKLADKIQIYGNLPYSFSTDIVLQTIRSGSCVLSATYLLQREFVARLAASPGGRDYGSLSIAVQNLAQVELGPVVSGDSFHPPTKVSSQLVRITPRVKPQVEPKDPVFFELVVRTAFRQRRKQLHNTLKGLPNINSEQIEQGLKAAEIDGKRRAETLSIFEYLRLVEELSVFCKSDSL